MAENIFPIFETILQKSEKEKLLNQKAVVIWMVGLSGSGKSTLARALENSLYEKGYLTKLLDGDNLRSGLNKNLSFSAEDRAENIRRATETAKLFLDCGVITICSFISPTEDIRKRAKEIIGSDNFVEVFINCPFDECAKRDVKGLYKKALAGQIKNFTGLDAPFDAPQSPDIEIRTDQMPIEKSLKILEEKVLTYIQLK